MAAKGDKAQNQDVVIYSLVDPRNETVMYIGKANDAKARLASHMRDRIRRKTPVYAWINELVDLGLSPRMDVICVCSEASWRAQEVAEIEKAKKANPNLLNLAKGGSEPYCAPAIRAMNGKVAAKARTSTPLKARVYYLNCAVGRMLKKGEISERNKEKLRYAAKKAPHLFGKWATI